MRTDAEEIIGRLYSGRNKAMEVLLAHSRLIAAKALELAHRVQHLGPDLDFIHEAAMLHDIGMLHTDAPMLGCSGELPYICHGVIGRGMLSKEGLERHGLVCERHVGVGLTAAEIRAKRLPLPERDMIPLSLEEKTVCLADKFFSKLGDRGEMSVAEARASLARYGEESARAFDSLMAVFFPPEGGHGG